MMIGTSRRISCVATTSGVIRADTPRMNKTLKMLLPTTLPRPMSDWPSHPALTDTAISGALVPYATIVSPMTNDDTPHAAAMRDAPRTSQSAPNTNKTRPAMK